MERKTTKMLAIVAVIGLCAVALIGAGYAAFSGSARTYNTSNSTTAEFLNLDAANFTAIVSAADIELDTYDTPTAGTDAYYFNATKHPAVTSVNGYTAVSLGSKVLTLTNNTNEDITSIDFGVKSDVAVGSTNFKYFVEADIVISEVHTKVYALVSTEEQTVALAPTAWSTAALEAGDTVDITVTLYYGYIADCSVPNSHIGATGAVGAANSTNAKLSTTLLAPADSGTFGLGFSVKQTA